MTEKTYTRPEIDGLREQVAVIKNGPPARTWQVLGQLTGVNYKTLQAWVAGSYDQGQYWKNQEVPAKVERYLTSKAEAQALMAAMPADLDFQMTPSAERMLTCLGLAQLGDIALVAAAPGCGKSVACRYFQLTRANVFVITASPAISAVNDVLQAILAALGEAGQRGSSAALSQKVRQKLRGAKALLILDEAQHVSKLTLEELRAIADETGVGLALVGDDTLPGNLKSHAQLHSRIGVSHIQLIPEPDDIDIVARGWGIEDPAALNYLQAIGAKANVGGLRRVSKVIRLARRAAGEEPVTASLLKDAFVQRYSEAG